MQISRLRLDWSVTREKVDEAVRRIVAADPLQIIAFGSRARGNRRPDSDLNFTVILDATEEEVHRRLPHSALARIGMPIDMIVVSK